MKRCDPQVFVVALDRVFLFGLLFFDKTLSCGWVRGVELPVLNFKRTGY
jgi:hypothetical protein